MPGPSAADSTVNAANPIVPPRDDRQTSPNVRPVCAKLAFRRAIPRGGGGFFKGSGGATFLISHFPSSKAGYARRRDTPPSPDARVHSPRLCSAGGPVGG